MPAEARERLDDDDDWAEPTLAPPDHEPMRGAADAGRVGGWARMGSASAADERKLDRARAAEGLGVMVVAGCSELSTIWIMSERDEDSARTDASARMRRGGVAPGATSRSPISSLIFSPM